jgi:hypothetical protein
MIGFTKDVPVFEHKYLGNQLTSKNSLATKIELNESSLSNMNLGIIEGRNFYYTHGLWYVIADVK